MEPSRFDGTAGQPRELLGRAGVVWTKEMRTIAGSACLLVMSLPVPLVAASPSGAAPVVAGEPTSGRSHQEATKAACALPGSCLAQARAGESDEIPPVETSQSRAATPSSAPTAVDGVCKALATAAAENDLPIEFLRKAMRIT
jgi:hypothetical protein